MSFLNHEESVEAGEPIELFAITNGEESFYYTSGQEVVNYAGHDYKPVPITRTEDKLDPGNNTTRSVVISVPGNDPLVTRYLRTVPALEDVIDIFRFHHNDGGTPEVVQVFKGRIANVAWQGHKAQINTTTEAAKFERLVPGQTCRTLCNHVLYNFRCKIDDSVFRLLGTITAISDDGLVVTVDTGNEMLGSTGKKLSAQLIADPKYFNGGSLERGGRERRMIRAMVDAGGNTANATVLLPLSTSKVGDSIVIFAGCDHHFTTCRTKFDNTINFGGFPYVPLKNVFEVGLGIKGHD